MQSLIIEIGDLAGKPGASKKVHKQQAIPGMGGPLAWIEDDDPVDVVVELESLDEGVAVSGRASGVLHLSCSRCLADFQEAFEQRVEEVFYFDGERAVEMDGYGIQEMTIDLEPMLRDVLVLGMPINPLHAADCRGLCPVCGQDLNIADCGHTKGSPDLRWAPLRAMLLEQSEG